VPTAALLHDPPRARVFAQPVARSCLGRRRLRRGANGRRAHSPTAHDARTVREGRPRADRTRRRLPVLGQRVKNRAARRRTELFGLLRAFRDAAAALPDALVATDEEQRILWFNAAAGGLLGLAYPTHRGARLRDVV